MIMTRRFLAAGLLAASLGASGLFALALALHTAPAAAEEAPKPAAPAVREIEVVVDGGYKPDRIVVTEGERVRLKFVRKDYSPCAREVVFESLGIRRDLPVDVPVLIDLPALSPGEVEFKCWMKMLRGVIVVEPRK